VKYRPIQGFSFPKAEGVIPSFSSDVGFRSLFLRSLSPLEDSPSCETPFFFFNRPVYFSRQSPPFGLFFRPSLSRLCQERILLFFPPSLVACPALFFFTPEEPRGSYSPLLLCAFVPFCPVATPTSLRRAAGFFPGYRAAFPCRFQSRISPLLVRVFDDPLFQRVPSPAMSDGPLLSSAPVSLTGAFFQTLFFFRDLCFFSDRVLHVFSDHPFENLFLSLPPLTGILSLHTLTGLRFGDFFLLGNWLPFFFCRSIFCALDPSRPTLPFLPRVSRCGLFSSFPLDSLRVSFLRYIGPASPSQWLFIDVRLFFP